MCVRFLDIEANYKADKSTHGITRNGHRTVNPQSSVLTLDRGKSNLKSRADHTKGRGAAVFGYTLVGFHSLKKLSDVLMNYLPHA